MKKQLLFEFISFLYPKMLFRLTVFTVLFFLSTQSSFAQKWNVIGDDTAGTTNISSVASYYTSITVVNDVPYVAYVEGGTSGGTARVKKRNIDGTWSQVGGSPFGVSVAYTRIFSDSTGKLYVVGVDKTGGLLSVCTLNVNTWVRTNISTNSVTYTGPSDTRFDMAFDSNNIPYIAYSERIGTTSGYPWVKRLVNSVWETVGTGAVQTIDSFAAAIDIALDANNVPYLVYINQTYNSTGPAPLKAYRYSSNNNWEDITPLSNTVGTISTSAVRYSSIAMDADNNPVVCYFNYNDKNKSTIIRYNKTTSAWDSPVTLSTRDAYSLYLINDNAGNLYNIFSDALISGGLSSTVRVFKNQSETSVFNELENLPMTSPSLFGIDGTGDNSTTARTTKIANLSIAVGIDTSKPYLVYTKTNAGGIVTPIVRVFDPLITTTDVNAITAIGATVSGELLASALAVGTVTERGIVYSSTVNPTTSNTKIVDAATTTGVFTSSITGLTPTATYYAKAYFIYSDGTNSFTVYGDNKKFTTTALSDSNSVTVTDNGTTVVMNNGIVKATIEKSSARVTSLIYNGLEMLKGKLGTGSVYWSWNMDGIYDEPNGCTYTLTANPNTNNFEYAEIKLRMTYNNTTTSVPMDVDVYYSLPKNASGLYASATLSHPEAYPALSGGEWRMAAALNDRFDWLSVDALRNRKMPSYTDAVSSVAVNGAPKEVTRYVSGIYNNQYECKYDYSADFGDTDAWGWSSTTDNVGLWVTTPSKEYYPGGPMKRELMSHGETYLMNYIGGTHFGQGHETQVAAGQEWQKNYGPFLLYCNKVPAGTPNANIALWEDAKTQAKTEQNTWPYAWFTNPTYAKTSDRGTLTGKLVINDVSNPNASPANTWVGVAIPPTGTSSATQFQRWSTNYQFWVKTDANGNFSIPDVLPGTYSFFAFGPGANGQLSLSDYATVTAGATTALGNVNWTPMRVAPTVWEIGKPDRSAMEFKHGNDWWTSNTYPDPRWGIFMNYPDEFPNDVNFTIGQSNIATDWNYVHYWDKSVRTSSPAWKVNFDLAAAPKTGSIASVYVAAAEVNGAALILSVNGTNVTLPLTGLGFTDSSNAMIRKGIHGAFNEVRFDFPVSYLKAGANQITFTLRVTGSGTIGNVMYDYIRLEADIPVCLAPTFTSSPTNTNASTAANTCDATVDYTAIASENPTYSYVFTGATTGSGTGTGSVSKFNKGTTQVAITATNSCGNATHSFDIIVSDSTKPTITAPQNIQIGTTTNNPVTGVQLGTPIVLDNCSTTNNLIVTNDVPVSFPQGTTTVTWTATDESGNSQTATQQVIVTTNTVPKAVSDQISVANGGTATVLVGNGTSVLTNDTDIENNTLSAILVSNVTNGTLTLNSNGTFSYVHNGSSTTSDSFSYKANDGTSDSNIVSVNITIAPFALANNNFTIESKSETCANKNNGQIIINALNSYNYTARINGINYPFVNNSLTVSNLAPGTHSVCITIEGKTFEQCYSVTIGQGGTITAKSTISSDKVAVEITEGTAPYQVYVNGTQKFETTTSNFTVAVQQGDLLEVKTAKACEGVYSKSIVGLSGNVAAFPNPTHGSVEITLPTAKKEVIIELYTVAGQLISTGNFIIVNQKAQLNLEKLATGAYLAKVYVETPVTVKIIKN